MKKKDGKGKTEDVSKRALLWHKQFGRKLYLRSLQMQGMDVSMVQCALNEMGFGRQTDGCYGEQTQMAVLAFQKAAKIEEDGVVGPETWSRLIGC
ncbi:MAG: peptidoglycan-binding domain-containing protein [Christensenellales bacterium]|mgnify:CR=1 FL=1